MRRVRRLALLVWCLLVPAVAMPPAAQATQLTWNLAADFKVAPDQANPNPDQYGNPEVWWFMSGQAQDTATFALLPEFISDAFAVDGLEQWQGIRGEPTDKLPAVGVNATGVDQQLSSFSWPASVVRVHPLRKRSAVLGWQSPIDGAVDVNVLFTDLDPTGGNGFRWAVLLNDDLEGYGISGNGGGGGIEIPILFLSPGDFLYFVVGSYQGDYSYDSTQLDLTITQVQG
jgi:hypothetical protein